MTLPALLALEECSDFRKTVQPFIPQLYQLPSRLLEVVLGRQSLLDVYLNTNPLIFGFAISIALGAVFLVVSEINKNYSQVDRCWSLLPTLYIAHFNLWARLSGVPSQKLDAALFWSVLWSTRLTFNYWRKGGYEVGSEDYRWDIIREYVPSWVFHIFNWTFISFIQSFLLFALAVPVYVILLSTQFEPRVTGSDLIYVALELVLIVVEVFADQQQWDFQGSKKEYQRLAKVPRDVKQSDLDRGFITSGLWAYSRHPNFAAEQSIWFLQYQWGCFATKSLYNWTAVGPSSLILLFQGSTWLTELITSGKYPEYAEYQKRVGMFVPVNFIPYATPVVAPKIIRTSDIAKKIQHKEKEKQARKQK